MQGEKADKPLEANMCRLIMLIYLAFWNYLTILSFTMSHKHMLRGVMGPLVELVFN